MRETFLQYDLTMEGYIVLEESGPGQVRRLLRCLAGSSTQIRKWTHHTTAHFRAALC